MDTSIFITDNNIILDDSDSDTSSLSTVDELKSYKCYDDSYIITRTQLADKIVKPIKSHSFYYKEQNQEIQDDFELALLRLIHIFFGSDGVINFTRLTKHMDLNNLKSKQLEDFFLDYPGIMDDSDFYSTEAGIKLRITWYNFLSDIDFFTYVHQTHQIIPSNDNFLSFITNFFPLINLNDCHTIQDKLSIIYSAFSFYDIDFQVVYMSNLQIDNEIISDSFTHHIIINGIELFLLKSIQIKNIDNTKKYYRIYTELKYS
jgi:hypothetical protein